MVKSLLQIISRKRNKWKSFVGDGQACGLIFLFFLDKLCTFFFIGKDAVFVMSLPKRSL